MQLAYELEGRPTKHVQAAIDLGDHRRLRALAEASNRPLASLIREAVTNYLSDRRSA